MILSELGGMRKPNEGCRPIMKRHRFLDDVMSLAKLDAAKARVLLRHLHDEMCD